MTKTFTKQEAIDLTYDHNTRTTAHTLEWFLNLANQPTFLAASSVFIHAPDDPNYTDLTINIEAYDDDFYTATETDDKLNQYVKQVKNTLTKLFPHMTLELNWYSGFNYHRNEYLKTYQE